MSGITTVQTALTSLCKKFEGLQSITVTDQDGVVVLRAPDTQVEDQNAEQILKRSEFSGAPQDEVWYRLVGAMYLKDFGLDSRTAYMAACAEDVRRILVDNPCLDNSDFYVPRPDRPGVFVMGGIMLAPVGFIADGNSTIALQMSPNYAGFPYYPNDSKVTYTSATENGGDLESIAGGGLIETFAFGGAAPAPQEQSGGKVQVGFPTDGPLSLCKAAGISSAAPASTLQKFQNAAKLDPKSEVWPVTSTTFPGPQAAQTHNLGDGGSQDNSGLLALLQRGGKKVVWIANCYRGLSTTYDYDNATVETFDPDAAGVVEQLYDKFGYGYNTSSYYYANNQVFSKNQLLPLVRRLVDLKQRGKPAIVRAHFELQANSYWGIEGGPTVEILLVYLEKVADFEKSLPPDTKAELAKGEEGLFPNFPLYKTGVGLPACDVNLLAAQGEYCVKENMNMFRSFLQGRHHNRGGA